MEENKDVYIPRTMSEALFDEENNRRNKENLYCFLFIPKV